MSDLLWLVVGLLIGGLLVYVVILMITKYGEGINNIVNKNR